jgi:predicted TIM-barrel fold metal-dependent hydrolase
MDLKYGVVSVDDHVQEHPDVWLQRLSKAQFGDRIPHVATARDGSQQWVVDGKPLNLKGGASAGVAAVGGSMVNPVREPQRWEEVPREAYVPAERLAAMNIDGIDVSVLYPNVAGLAGEIFGRIADPALELACVQAYNDYLIDEWAGPNNRFVAQCLVPLSTADAAIAEIRRAVKKGHKGVVFPAVPWHVKTDLPHINEAYYDEIWSTLEELDVPLCFHAGSSEKLQFKPYEGQSPGIQAALNAITRPISSAKLLPNLLFSGILDRHPRLQVVFAESTLSWGSFSIESSDHHYNTMGVKEDGHPVMPSELFRRQCFFTSWYGDSGMKERRFLGGPERLLWCTNYPLTTSTWPNTSNYIRRTFEGVPVNEQRKVLWGNANQLYHLNLL